MITEQINEWYFKYLKNTPAICYFLFLFPFDLQLIGCFCYQYSSIQMQYSKVDRHESGCILRKLQKIKNDVGKAVEYLELEKCMGKLKKISEAIDGNPDRKMRKELRGVVEKCEDLVKEKTKYFKKKIIEQMNYQSVLDNKKEGRINSESKQKTLKYSKSMDNFELVQQMSKLKQSKDEESFCNEKTEVTLNKREAQLEKKMEGLMEEVEYYKKRVSKLEENGALSVIGTLCAKVGQRDGAFDQQMGYKLRQKGLQIQQLKGRVKYYQQKNQQLKNRLQNQLRRQDDYVTSLKSHNDKLSTQLQTQSKQTRKLQQQLNKAYYICDGYKQQVKALSNEVDYLQKQRRQSQSFELLRMRDGVIKKQLQTLSQQQRYMREMQQLVEVERDENNNLVVKIQMLEKQMKLLEEENAENQKENENLSDMLQIRGEEMEELKKQLIKLQQTTKSCEQQLLQTRSSLLRVQQQLQTFKLRRHHDKRNKLQNLHRVRQLLTGL